MPVNQSDVNPSFPEDDSMKQYNPMVSGNHHDPQFFSPGHGPLPLDPGQLPFDLGFENWNGEPFFDEELYKHCSEPLKVSPLGLSNMLPPETSNPLDTPIDTGEPMSPGSSVLGGHTLATENQADNKNNGDNCCDQCGTCFTRSGDLKRHTQEQHAHDHGRNLICGNCQLGNMEKSYTRSDRLKTHLKKEHGLTTWTEDLIYQSHGKKIYFAFKADRDQYSRDTPPDTEDGHSGATTDVSSALEQSAHSSCTASAKRPAKGEPTKQLRSRSKRRKREDLDQLQWKVQTPPQTGMISPKEALDDIEIIPNCIIGELLNLTERESFKDLLSEAKTMGLSSKVVFADRSIRLQGPIEARNIFKQKFQRYKSSIFKGPKFDFSGPKDARIQSAEVYSHDAGPTVQVLAIRAKEDSVALGTWIEHIQPNLSTILTPYVGGNFSASLVRQRAIGSAIRPTIRIQSTDGQNESARRLIKAELDQICADKRRPKMEVSFSRGSLVFLSSVVRLEPAQDGPPNDWKILHHQRRFQESPGMSASIGIGNCTNVSATLGVYIKIRDEKHMLTVDHLLQFSQRYGTHSKDYGDYEVTSPSIFDINTMKQVLEQSLRDNEAKIQDKNKDREVSLDDLHDCLSRSDPFEERRILEGWLHDLRRPAGEFVIGKVEQRCSEGVYESFEETAFQRGSKKSISHLMDWVVFSLNKRGKRGINRFRYDSFINLTIEDFWSEKSSPKGAGIVCNEIGEAEPNDRVFFIGRTTGRQEGEINATLMSIEEDSQHYQEHTILPDNPDLEFRGDSGACIIRIRDNKLLGLLWGFEDKHLLFTRIQDIFADIRKVTRHDVTLCTDTTSGPSNNRTACIGAVDLRETDSLSENENMSIRFSNKENETAKYHIAAPTDAPTDTAISGDETLVPDRRSPSIPDLTSSSPSSPESYDTALEIAIEQPISQRRLHGKGVGEPDIFANNCPRLLDAESSESEGYDSIDQPATKEIVSYLKMPNSVFTGVRYALRNEVPCARSSSWPIRV